MLNRRSLLEAALGAAGISPFLNLGSAKAELCVGAWAPSDIITLDPGLVYPEVMRSFSLVHMEERCKGCEFPLDIISPKYHYKAKGPSWMSGKDGKVTVPLISVNNSIEYKSYGGEYYSKPQVVERARQILFAGLTKKIKDDIFHTLLAAAVDRNFLSSGLSSKRLNYLSPEVIESWRVRKSVFSSDLPPNMVEDLDFGAEYDNYIVNGLKYRRSLYKDRHFGVAVNHDALGTAFIEPTWGKPKFGTNVHMEYDEDFNFMVVPWHKEGYERMQVIMVYGVAVLDSKEITLLSLRAT